MSINEQGYASFYNGQIVNPYLTTIKGVGRTYTIAAKEWERGYNKAYFENLNNLNRKQA